MRRSIVQRRLGVAAAGVLGWVVASGALAAHAALLEFFGEDPKGSSSVPLTAAEMVESMAAEAEFKSQLPGTVTETFEGIATGTGPPFAIFSGTTTLNGSGSVAHVEAGVTNGAGRYSVPIPPGSTQYWDVGAGDTPTFTVDFSAPVAAFGFFGVDLGDGSGTLRLAFRNGGLTVLDREVPLLQGPEADGSVLFFGVIAPSEADRFDQVQFNSTALPGQGVDYFGFDNLTIVPEPSAAWQALVAMSALLVLLGTKQLERVLDLAERLGEK